MVFSPLKLVDKCAGNVILKFAWFVLCEWGNFYLCVTFFEEYMSLSVLPREYSNKCVIRFQPTIFPVSTNLKGEDVGL